jgi:long-chain acyl-CoA synthetase
VITALPLYHIFALTANCLLFVLHRLAHNVLIPNPRDFPGFVARAAQVSVHVLRRRQHPVQRAAAHAGFDTARLQPLRCQLGGGMAVQARRRRAVEAGDRQSADPGLGPHRDLACRVHQPARDDFNGSIGLPIPSTEMRSSMTPATSCRIGQSARSACAARR